MKSNIMAFKIKHIATRFLIQSIFTILIISTLIFIMFYSGYRKKDTIKAISLKEEVRSNIDLLAINLDKAFDLQKADLKFVESKCDELLLYHNNQIRSINDTIEKISALPYLKSTIAKSKLADSLAIVLERYSIAHVKVLLSLKEKGNSAGGVVNLAIQAIDKVANELEFAPDNGLQAVKFRSYASAYLADYSYSNLFNLIQFTDDILTPFYYYEDYDISSLASSVSELSKVLARIKSIDLRLLDKQANIGQLLDANIDHKLLARNFSNYSRLIDEQTAKYNKFWNWIFTLLAIVLLLAYVLVMGRFSRIVWKSIRDLHKVTITLAKGKIKEDIQNSGHYEFKAFNNDLKSLFELLKSRKDFINMLLAEKFENELVIKSEDDEIGNALLKLQDKMHAAQKEQEKYTEENTSRRYVNEGLAKFSEIMRINSHDTTMLADKLIKELVKYMEAMQGGLFLVEENNREQLELVAAFAYDRKRFLNKTVPFGEGLIGTCAVEKKVINLTEIPENYIQIKSGLGDAPPNNILILPVINEDEMVGVIELASLNKFADIELELAENIASGLASTIVTARNNSRTSQLLKKSQEQAAEMAEQEEEMRQNMEELKATQEESSRREEEMQGLLDAMGKSFYVLEYDINGVIIHINDRLISFIDQPVQQIMHSTHQDIFSTDSVINAELIRKIVDDAVPVTTSEILNWGSKKYEYNYSLSPVFASNGKVVKILNLFRIEEIQSES